MGGWVGGWLGGWLAGWVGGWLTGWLAGRVGGWMDGWRRLKIQTQVEAHGPVSAAGKPVATAGRATPMHVQ